MRMLVQAVCARTGRCDSTHALAIALGLLLNMEEIDVSEEALEKPPGAESPSSCTNRGVKGQTTTSTDLRVDGEIDKQSESEHNEPNRSENGVVDGDIEERATFELGIEESKDLLSLSEELSSILDPKVDQL